MNLPMIARVDAQPLLLLTDRLREAMETIGTPLPTEVQARIAGLSVEDEEEAITAAIQESLDPLCVAAVTISAAGSVEGKHLGKHLGTRTSGGTLQHPIHRLRLGTLGTLICWNRLGMESAGDTQTNRLTGDTGEGHWVHRLGTLGTLT